LIYKINSLTTDLFWFFSCTWRISSQHQRRDYLQHRENFLATSLR